MDTEYNIHTLNKLIVALLAGLLTSWTVAGDVNASGRCTTGEINQSYSVMFFQPDESRSEFWRASNRFAEAVARDLNIHLDFIPIDYSQRDRDSFKKLTLDALRERPKPDFILSVLYGGGEYIQLDVFNQHAIPFVTFNSSLDNRILELTGQPRELFTYWKGHISPDEIAAGAKLVSSLSTLSNGKTLAMLGGSTESVVNNHRIKGAMEQAKRESLSIIPAIHTDWNVEKSRLAAETLLRRVPDVDMIWTAGPEVAKGAIQFLTEVDRQVAVGSFDWARMNLELVRDGSLSVSYGGHFMEAGWALVMIYDYLSGVDFQSDPGVLVLSELMKLEQANIAAIEPLLVEENWDNVDFTKYSKCLNGKRDIYDFTLKMQ